MSFAVIQTGGKQYKISVGDQIQTEKLNGDLKEGYKVVLDQVLLKDDGKSTEIGTPNIKGASVSATIVKSGRHDKITVIRYKAKSRYYKKRGHRQPFMNLKIDSIK